MKYLKIYSLFTFLGLFAVSSCNKDSETSIDTSFAEMEGQADDSFSEVDGIMEASLNFYNVGGRVEESVDSLIACADKSINLETKTITIDFGSTGCQGRGGRIRKGKIIITYTNFLFLPGSGITTTFDNFYINDIKIEGTRTLTNISESVNVSPKFHVTLENGKLTWPDETSATRESDFTETWTRALNPVNDEITVEGSASGTTRKGKEYTMTIKTPLLYRKACWLNRSFIAVSGVKEIVSGKVTMSVDYGDGTCDRIVTITVNGVSRTIEATKGI